MSRTRLILIPELANAPAPYLILDEAGGVLQRGRLALDEAETPAVMRTVAIAPGGDVSVRWLDLPVGGAAQVRAAALWMLRDDLAAEPDRVTLSLGQAVAAGQPRLVAVVSLALVRAWTDYLEGLGVKADVILPDVLTLRAPDDDGVLKAAVFGSGLALRGQGFAATVQPDLADLIAAGRSVRPVIEEAEIERMMAAAALSPEVNLLDNGVQNRAVSKGSWRLAAGLAAVLLLSPLVLALAQASRDEMAVRGMQAETVALIERAAPEAARSPDPVAAFRQNAASAPPPGGIVSAAAVLFAAVESVEGAELDIFVSDPEGGVRATVSYPAYQDLDAMKHAVAAAGMRMTDTSTLDDAGRVVSDVTIGAAA
jgi:general secretion pathway protein L